MEILVICPICANNPKTDSNMTQPKMNLHGVSVCPQEKKIMSVTRIFAEMALPIRLPGYGRRTF